MYYLDIVKKKLMRIFFLKFYLVVLLLHKMIYCKFIVPNLTLKKKKKKGFSSCAGSFKLSCCTFPVVCFADFGSQNSSLIIRGYQILYFKVESKPYFATDEGVQNQTIFSI